MAPQQPDQIAQALLTLESLYDTYAAPALPPPVNTMVSTLLSSALTVQPYASSILTQSSALVTNLLTGDSNNSNNSNNSPGNGIVSTIVLLVTVYLSFKILNYVRRTIIGWIFLAIKIVIVMVMVQVAIYAYSNGLDKTVRDAGWIFGMLQNLAETALGQDTSNSASKGTAWKNPGWGRDQVPLGKKRSERWW